MPSGNFSWDPSPEEVTRAFAALREAMGLTQEELAARLGTSPTTVGKYERAPGKERWLNPIRMMRFYADEAPGGGRVIAGLLGLSITEEEQDRELRRRLRLVRSAYQSDSPVVRQILAALEAALEAGTKPEAHHSAATPRASTA